MPGVTFGIESNWIYKTNTRANNQRRTGSADSRIPAEIRCRRAILMLKVMNSGKILPTMATVWFIAAAAVLTIEFLKPEFRPGLWVELYCLAVVLLSPITMLVYGWDKWSAKSERRRIPEKRLHLLAVLGGWPGAVCGQRLFRHKTAKTISGALLAAIIILHLLLIVGWTVLQLRPVASEEPDPVATVLLLNSWS